MNADEYRDFDSGEVTGPPNISRREFLKTIGGGVAVFFWLGGDSELEAQRRRPPSDFNAYLRIAPDGKVSCFTGKIEMGQGVITSLAQMLAEELDVSVESIDMVMGDTARCPYDAGTWGSMSTPYFGQPILRAAGAKARAILVELAAARLNVPKDQLAVNDGVVFDKTRTQHKVTYAELAQGKPIAATLGSEALKKAVSEFQVIGRPYNRTDGRLKVTGKAEYTADLHIAGMVCAKVLRPPAHGAKLKSLDTSAVDEMDGFQVVRDDDLVAVLHRYPDAAEEALTRLNAEYDIPEVSFDDETVFNYFVDNAGDGEVASKDGDLGSGERLAKDVVEQTYLNSYVAHAPIEPHAAVAQVEGDKVTVWASTQTPFGLQGEIAGALRIPLENVRVVTPFVGGGFGGKISNGQAMQAVRLARIVKKPVQVAWSREDEFFYDTFRPAAAVKIRSGMTDSGKIVMWDCAIYGMGGRGAEMFYDIPHYRTTVSQNLADGKGMHVFATGPWRAPHNNTNSFARESHIDVMAAKAGIDALEFRLKNLTDKKMRKVLEEAADRFGWTAAQAPSGRGFGIACGSDVNVPVALVAEVRVNERTGRIQVKRVVCAMDLGLVINPEGARLQVEGCITMGLGYVLSEEVRFKGGRIIDLNFDSYELPRFSWLPQIESVILETDKSRPLGGGEPAIICMGGVIANAVYDATGSRVIQLPMTPKRVKKALAERTQERAAAT